MEVIVVRTDPSISKIDRIGSCVITQLKVWVGARDRLIIQCMDDRGVCVERLLLDPTAAKDFIESMQSLGAQLCES
jgi:hypothetical protein